LEKGRIERDTVDTPKFGGAERKGETKQNVGSSIRDIDQKWKPASIPTARNPRKEAENHRNLARGKKGKGGRSDDVSNQIPKKPAQADGETSLTYLHLLT